MQMTPTPESEAPQTPPRRRPRARRGDARVARVYAVVPEILAIHSGSLPRCARRAVVSSAELTSTGLAVFVLAPIGEPPCAVIKVPMTPSAARGLQRETAILAALHDEQRLGRWREFLPRPCAHGSVRGQPYRVDAALRGRRVREVMAGAGGHRTLLNVAADAIDGLHQSTAATLPGSVDVAELWVDPHLRELARHAGRRRAMTLRLERLRDELHDALAGNTFTAGWIHGDYWLGNLLFSGAGSTRYVPTGIVDWDASAPRELPLHDLLHLLLYTRRLNSGRELGHIVRGHLLGGGWSAEERVVLDRHATWHLDRALSERHAVLLYWLRQVAMHARQQSPPVGYHYRLWERRNVLTVLASL